MVNNMLQNTTHYNQDDFRVANFVMGAEKLSGTIKLKHVERDFQIDVDMMKPSRTMIRIGEIRGVQRQLKKRPVKIQIRSKQNTDPSGDFFGDFFRWLSLVSPKPALRMKVNGVQKHFNKQGKIIGDPILQRKRGKIPRGLDLNYNPEPVIELQHEMCKIQTVIPDDYKIALMKGRS